MWLQFGGFVNKVAFSFRSQGTEKIFSPKGPSTLLRISKSDCLCLHNLHNKIVNVLLCFLNISISTFVYTKEVR